VSGTQADSKRIWDLIFRVLPGLDSFSRYQSSWLRGNLVFFNADYFRERVRAAIAAVEGSVEWLVIDARPVNVVDVTGMQKFDELREELADRGIQLIIAGGKQMLGRYFNRGYADGRRERNASLNYPTLKSAIRAFETRNSEATVSSDQT
jgi:MFS superfamily sulfate permease-like transporter